MGQHATELARIVRKLLDDGTIDAAACGTPMRSLVDAVCEENPNPAIMQGELYHALVDVEAVCSEQYPNIPTISGQVDGLCKAARKKWDDAAEANAWRPQIAAQRMTAGDTPLSTPLAKPKPNPYRYLAQALAECGSAVRAVKHGPMSKDHCFRKIVELSNAAIRKYNSGPMSEDKLVSIGTVRLLEDIQSLIERLENPDGVIDFKSECLVRLAVLTEAAKP